MDDETSELIQQLCTRVGMIMEDASTLTLLKSGAVTSEKVEVLRFSTSEPAPLWLPRMHFVELSTVDWLN